MEVAWSEFIHATGARWESQEASAQLFGRSTWTEHKLVTPAPWPVTVDIEGDSDFDYTSVSARFRGPRGVNFSIRKRWFPDRLFGWLTMDGLRTGDAGFDRAYYVRAWGDSWFPEIYRPWRKTRGAPRLILGDEALQRLFAEPERRAQAHRCVKSEMLSSTRVGSAGSMALNEILFRPTEVIRDSQRLMDLHALIVAILDGLASVALAVPSADHTADRDRS